MENTTAFYFFSFLKISFLILSFLGWGSLLARFLVPGHKIDFGQRAAWGVAFTIFIGGILNVLMVISRPTVIVYVLLGVIHFFALEFSAIRSAVVNLPTNVSHAWRFDKIAFLGVLVILGILIFYCQAALWRGPTFDDKEAYAMFPQKMLQQGGFGYEPFCDRRLMALGGQSFLHAIVLSGASLYSLLVMDRGIGYILMVALLWVFSKALNVSGRAAVFICILFLIIPVQQMNISSFVMALALILALFRSFGHLQEEAYKGRVLSRLFISALLTSAILASKATYMAFCAAYILTVYGTRIYFTSEKGQAFKEVLLTLVFIILFLLPWMISSYQSSGTFLFPVLGKGVAAYGMNEHPAVTWDYFVNRFWYFLYSPYFFFSGVFLLILVVQKSERHLWGGIVFFSSFIGALVLNVILAADENYNWPIKYAAFAVLMMLVLGQGGVSKDVKKLVWLCIVLCIPWLFRIGLQRPPPFRWSQLSISNQEAVRSNILTRFVRLSFAGEELFCSKAQRSVPEGETILARVPFPAVLDFHRNKILVLDWGTRGPAPGVPLSAGGEALAKYFLQNNIRYIMFAYKGRWVTQRSFFRDYWVSGQTDRLRKFENGFLELGKTRKRIYDDGRIFVLDLRL